MEEIEFEAFPKIARLHRDIVVTEKIDGTNAQVHISDDGNTVRAASRTRWIKPGDDNFAFAKWVADHENELKDLGPGRHFGEWWGSGIQRGYGLKEKRFSLFNTDRWSAGHPECCSVVPVLYKGPFDHDEIMAALERLAKGGSQAAPGYMNPEGVIVWHNAARQLFKITIENDGEPKSVSVKV